jgi:peptidoglycan L-alanyl-D-glutamate endopeptidase CwlK
MYNLVDNDGVLDFYAGVPTKLDKRASSNGFKTNVAWLAVHEMCHGLLQQQKRHDCTHEMEAQGRLQELWFELYGVWNKNKMTLADKLVSLINFLKKPDTLLPEVQRRADRLIKMMEQAGHPIRITETYRTAQRQNELYSQGRTKPGQIVTNARAGESFHQWKVAFDVVFIKEGFNAPNSLWELLGEVGEGIGLEWGGRWTSFPDRPHLQYTAGYTLSDFQSGKVDYKKFI